MGLYLMYTFMNGMLLVVNTVDISIHCNESKNRTNAQISAFSFT